VVPTLDPGPTRVYGGVERFEVVGGHASALLTEASVGRSDAHTATAMDEEPKLQFGTLSQTSESTTRQPWAASTRRRRVGTSDNDRNMPRPPNPEPAGFQELLARD
jgi:hypothetical protein